MDLYINDKKINYNDDIKISKYNDKSLENITLQFELENERLDAEIKSYALLGNKNYYVLDFEEVEFTFNNYIRYEYTVNLVEPTIDLHDIILPNRAITRRTNLPRKTAVQVIGEYLEIYAPHIKISSNLRNKLGDKPVGDFAWNNPTLYDVINDIIRAELNIIPVMHKFNELDFKDLDAVGMPINNDDIDAIMRRNDYNQYGKALRYNLTDARYVENKLGLEDEKAYVLEYLKPITLDAPILKDDDWAIYTEHPIDEIYEVRFIAWEEIFLSGISIPFNKKDFDITDKIVEKSVYDTLMPSNLLLDVEGDYKRDKVFYERGKNKIDGWNYNDKTWVPILNVDRITWQNIFSNKTGTPIDIVRDLKPRTFLMSVAYKPMIKDVSGDAIKDMSKINRYIMSGQQEKTVNLDYFGRFNKDILDQLGEDELIIKGSNTTPNLMDYFEDFYIYKIDIENSDGNNNWQAYLKRNYNEINISMALDYDKRFFERAGIDEAVISNHINNINYTLATEQGVLDNTDKNMIHFFTSNAFGDGYAIRQFYNFFRMRYEDRSTSEWFVRKLLPMTVGNSFLLYMKMDDNYAVGTKLKNAMYIDNLDEDEKDKGITQPLIPYVDNRGEFVSFDTRVYMGVYRLLLGDDFDIAYDIKEYPIARRGVEPNYNSIDAEYDKLMYSEDNILRYKDTREITAETLQFNFLNTDKLIFYPHIFFRNRLATISYESDDARFYLYVNRDKNKKYNRYSKIMGENLGEGQFTATSTGITVNITGEFYGWCIYADNEPLLAYNGNDTQLYWIISKQSFIPPLDPYNYIYFRIKDSNNDYILEDRILEKPIKIINNGERLIIKYSDDSQVLFNDLLENYKNPTSLLKYTTFYFDDGSVSGMPELKVKIKHNSNIYEGYIQREFGFADMWYLKYWIIGGINNGAVNTSLQGNLYNAGGDVSVSISNPLEIEIFFGGDDN